MGKTFRRNSHVDEAKLIQVIAVESVVGDGTTADPVRVIREYYSTEGMLLARTNSLTDLQIGSWESTREPSK